MKRAEARFSPSIILQSVLTLGMLVLVFELHMLRTTVDDHEVSAAIADGGGFAAQLESVLRRLLTRFEQMPAPAQVAPRDANSTANSQRTLVAGGLEDRLTEITQAIQRLAASNGRGTAPAFMGHSAPMNPRSVVSTHVELKQDEDVAKRDFLLLSTADLLARFGKPTDLSVTPSGSIRWIYEVEQGEESKTIAFTLHNGYVVRATPYQ